MAQHNLLHSPRPDSVRSTDPHSGRWLATLLIAIGSLLGASCVSNSRSFTSFGMEQARVSQGMLTLDIRDDGLEQMARALPGHRADPAQPGRIELIEAEETDLLERSHPGADGRPVQFVAESARLASSTPELPADAGKLIALPKMSRTELDELIEALRLKIETERGYREARPDEQRLLPPVPENIFGAAFLAQPVADQIRFLRFGHRRFLSQAPQLWIQGVTAGNAGGALSRNADLDVVASTVTNVLGSMNELRAQLTGQDLAFKIVQLSYIDIKSAITNLKGFGFTTLDDPSKIPSPIQFQQLPIIAAMPSPTEVQTGLLGDKTFKDLKMA